MFAYDDRANLSAGGGTLSQQNTNEIVVTARRRVAAAMTVIQTFLVPSTILFKNPLVDPDSSDDPEHERDNNECRSLPILATEQQQADAFRVHLIERTHEIEVNPFRHSYFGGARRALRRLGVRHS
jgi:hypothetical protein